MKINIIKCAALCYFQRVLFSSAQRIPHLYAADRRAIVRSLKPKIKISKRNEQRMETANAHDTLRLVSPSGEEIHDFLYPTPKNGKL
jgi:hypothetical protein